MVKQSITIDVLIIGGGAAGLNAALNLKKDFLLLEQPGSNSVLSPWNLMTGEKKILKEKIIKTGCQKNDQKLVDLFLTKIPEAIKDLEKIGVKLKKSNIGLVPNYSIVGKTVKDIFQVKSIITKVENFLVEKNKIIGVRTKENDIYFNHLILAAGGLGSLFQFNTGSPDTDGSILSLAHEAGLKLKNIEFFMFHPFLIVDPRLPRALVSGDLLTQMEYENHKGESFLSELVTQALKNNQHHYIFPQMVKEFYLQKNKIFGKLVCSSAWFEQFKKENEFGHIFKNFTKDQLKKIEIQPALHYTIGGLKINEKAQTSQKNIYAAGEITGGLHGYNRIGGLAILEALIFGKIAALEINKKPKKEIITQGKLIGNLKISQKTKKLAWQSLGPVKTQKQLNKFNQYLNKNKLSSQEKLLKEITQKCLKRKKSIGAFIKI